MKPVIVGSADKIKNVTKKDIDVLAEFMAAKYKRLIIIKKDSTSTKITTDGFEFEFLFNDREMVRGGSVRFFLEDNPLLINGMVKKRPIMETSPYQHEMLCDVEDFLEKVQEV